MERLLLQKHRILFLFVSLILTMSSNIFANQAFHYRLPGCCQVLHPVIAFGGGLSHANDVGDSQEFVDSALNRFFSYKPNHRSQTIDYYDAFVGVEWKYRPELIVQLGLDLNQITDLNVDGRLTQGAIGSTQKHASYNYNIVARQILTETKFLYHFSNSCFQAYHPYLLLGLGAAFNKANDFRTCTRCLTSSRLYKNHTETSLSWALGFGFDMDVAVHTRFGVGYRFIDYGKVKLGSATINSISVSGTLSQSDLYIHSIFAQVTFVL